MFEKILEKIRAADTIILHRHTNPDGDALGSQIGLKHILMENFPEKKVLMVGDEAGRYAFMADSVMDEVADAVFEDALAIVLDCSAKKLISDDRYTRAKETARIDHHIFCEKICDVEVQDTSFESCCGMIAAFAKECGLKLNPAAATALYTGMITDSGRFRYDATSARTHELAAFLMHQPIDTNEIYRNLYATDYAMMKLRAQFVLKIRFTEKNVAYIYTTREELAELDSDLFGVSRGMVSTMSDIRGVDIWANFTETDRGVLCELRSSRFNINPIAVRYGGGGHAKASGATLRDREEAMAMLRDLDAMMGGEEA
ncbi:MAG: bifunctional oligoribonuclease/PAP phosphatase NrnA [Clostridia bacterium]|nr:bifunctional oligoribonuclease/PAP phosphatase NrnA [Clostridia bacterium]